MQFIKFANVFPCQNFMLYGLLGITIEEAQVYCNALKNSDVSWYCGTYVHTFGMMH